MGLKYFKNQGKNKYELILHGIIGLDVDGSAIAREIAMLNEIGAEEITERINSIGGSVVDGFSIASANMRSKAKIVTVCEGVCDSIASVIFATGDERKIMEYGSILIHNVLINGVTLEEIEDESEKADAQRINDSIVNILTNKCGVPKKRLEEMMSAETRFNADEAIAEGFADEKILIGKGKKKPEIMENFSALEYMNICTEFSAKAGQNNNQNETEMKEVLKFLNLNAEASEQAVIIALKDLQNKAGKADDLQSEVGKLKAENDTLKKGKAESEVQYYIDKGLFDESKKDELVNLAMTQPDAFKALSLMKPEYVNISGQLNSGKRTENKGEKKDLTEKELAEKYENMSKNDPLVLERMEQTDPETFNKMYNAYIEVE